MTIAPTTRADSSRRAPRWLVRRSQWGSAALLLLPAFSLFAVFTAYPFVYAAKLSLTRWDGLSADQTWVGLGNYRELLDDPEFLHSLKVTAIYTLAVTVASIGLVRARRAEALARQEAETSRQVASFLTGLFSVSNPSEARGNTVTAREILDRGAGRISRELAAQPLVQAKLMQTMGVSYREMGLFAQAQAIATQRAHAAADDPDLQASVLELARLEQQQGRLAAAESLYRATLEVRERAFGPNDPRLVETLSAMGGMFVTGGRFAEAESLLTRAVALRAQRPAPEDVAYARTLRYLASAYLAEGRYADAEPLFRRALAMYERAGGADHPDVGRTLNNLGIVYYGLQRYDEAEQYYLRAEASLSKSLGENHPNIGSININLGEIAWRRHRLPDAEMRLRRALDIFQKSVVPTYPAIATAEYDLANVLRDAGRLAEAEPHYRKALQIRETAFGRDAPLVAEVLTEYAKMLRLRGRAAEAEQLETRARLIPPARH